MQSTLYTFTVGVMVTMSPHKCYRDSLSLKHRRVENMKTSALRVLRCVLSTNKGPSCTVMAQLLAGKLDTTASSPNTSVVLVFSFGPE